VQLKSNIEQGLLVKPEIASAQQKAESRVVKEEVKKPEEEAQENEGREEEQCHKGQKDKVKTLRQPVRFYGSVELSPTRMKRDIEKIADEVTQHLVALASAQVEITLEIRADVPQGVPDSTVRTVTENCRTLKFKTHGFEQ